MPNLQDILPPGIDPQMMQELMAGGGGGGMPGPGPISGGEMMPGSPSPQSMPQPSGPQPQGPPEGGGPQTIPVPGTAPEQTETGLNAGFEERFNALRMAIREQGGDLYIFAGPRTKEEQGQLLQETAAKYGDMKEAMKRVKATHDPEYGVPLGMGPGALAADIRGDLHLAHKLAPHFGLVFPSQSQPWHMEFAGIDKIKT
jgi:hypothetical protein